MSGQSREHSEAYGVFGLVFGAVIVFNLRMKVTELVSTAGCDRMVVRVVSYDEDRCEAVEYT